MLKKVSLLILIIFLNFCMLSTALAQDPDEAATFLSIAPDALIIMDLSGSMDWNPAGGNDVWGDSNCAGPFYGSSGGGHTTNCSRLNIAKRALFSILDDDNNSKIDSQDSNSLGIRLGFMRYRDGNDTAGVYSSGNARLIRGIGSTYQQIYCAASSTGTCTSTSTCGGSNECIANEYASGGTPLASTLAEAKKYLDYHKGLDTAASCRQKFVILLTDGSDTYACSSSGNECDDHSYNRRRKSVARVKALKDAGYRVFVIGFGLGMPQYLLNTLNWMAYFGGTEDLGGALPATPYDPLAVDQTDACNTTDSSFTLGSCQGANYSDWFATNNDPGLIPLSGYAFIASNSNELTEALKTAIRTIQNATYSFTQVSVQTVRTTDENYLYEASFKPLITPNNDPFWIGHLKNYTINPNGSIDPGVIWDAGAKLSTASSRNIYTYKSGSTTTFSTSLTAADLAVSSDSIRDDVVNYIIGGEPSGGDSPGWKLGDSFHCSPVTVGTPSIFYSDPIDMRSPKAYSDHLESHLRPSSSGKKIIIAGANDGQLHAFLTRENGGAVDSGGREIWSIIPPNFLPKLKLIAHKTEPSSLGHQYFVDGSIAVRDVWLGSGSGTNKSPGDWHTIMTVGLGRGGTSTLWSSSQYCDTGFSPTYSAGTYKYNCGYFNFDITNTLSAPVYKWNIGGSAGLTITDGSHLGQPWGKMIMTKVLISGSERWVGFIGAGYSGTTCAPADDACSNLSGKGFYVVDLKTGNVLKSFTRSSGSGLDYDLAATPAVIDFDNDGFADTAYVGDLGGNVWRFKFCENGQTTCTENNWTYAKLFTTTNADKPIYTMPTVAKDSENNIWVYFGTGDVRDPTALDPVGVKQRLFAIKDDRTSSGYSLSNLKSINSSTYSNTTDASYKGWYYTLPGNGEKMLTDPIVFAKVAYYATYTPTGNVCTTGGQAILYAFDYVTSAGSYNDGGTLKRSKDIGTGIPTGLTVSMTPDGESTSLYVTTSEGSGGLTHDVGSKGCVGDKCTDCRGKDCCPIPPCCTGANAANCSYPNTTNLFFWMDKGLQ